MIFIPTAALGVCLLGTQVTAMSGLRHENVDRLIGICSTERPYYLVTEQQDRGSLRDCLRDGSVPSDNVEALFDLCIQACVISSPHICLQRHLKHNQIFGAWCITN